MKEIIDEIAEKQKKKAYDKFEEVFVFEQAIVPDRTVVEQASSALTAQYAASLVTSTDTVADLTAGLGVNSYFFSKIVKKVFALEKDLKRASILEHNLNLTGIKNIEVINKDCLLWLGEPHPSFNTAFVDPSRRDKSGRKFLLSDCSPNVKELIPLLGATKRLLVKASPLLDLTAVMREIPYYITGFHIIEAENEVKELLLDLSLSSQDNSNNAPFVRCVRLWEGREPQLWEFSFDDLRKNEELPYLSDIKEITAGHYIYEPSASMMKSAMFGALGLRFEGVKKFSRSTHLFYSPILHTDFPGKIFKVEKHLGSGNLRRLKGQRFNVISRNHPASAMEIENRYHFKPSDKDFIIACRAGDKPAIFQVERVAVIR